MYDVTLCGRAPRPPRRAPHQPVLCPIHARIHQNMHLVSHSLHQLACIASARPSCSRPRPMLSATICCSPTSDLNGGLPSSLLVKPSSSLYMLSGLFASPSVRCITPSVIRRPHTGHASPRSVATSSGDKFTPHFRCPELWYLPSSGKELHRGKRCSAP